MDTRRGSSQLKKRDMGLAGAVIVLAQVISNFQSTRNLSNEIDQLKTEFHQVRSDQEQYFVKKEELKVVTVKLDSMSGQLSKIRNQIKSMTDSDVAFNKSFIGCSSFSQADHPSYLINIPSKNKKWFGL